MGAAGRNVIPHLIHAPLPQGCYQNTREASLQGDSVRPLWGTAVPHHEVKQNSGLGTAQKLLPIFLSPRRKLCPHPTEARVESGRGWP